MHPCLVGGLEFEDEKKCGSSTSFMQGGFYAGGLTLPPPLQLPTLHPSPPHAHQHAVSPPDGSPPEGPSALSASPHSPPLPTHTYQHAVASPITRLFAHSAMTACLPPRHPV